MFDAHNHLQFAEFDDDRDAALTRAIAAGVTGVALAGYDNSRRALAAALSLRPGVAAAAGIHPWAVEPSTIDAELEKLEALDWTPFCAVGELGLDFHRAQTSDARARQTSAFRRQLALARELDLPVVLHCVKANAELAAYLEGDGVPQRGGIVHSYWGSPEEAKRFVRLGLHLSVGTQITRAQPPKMVAALAEVGLERLTVETDAPSRPPASTGATRNEPAYLPCVVDAVALVLGTTAERVARATATNARQLFDVREVLAPTE